MTGLVLLAVLLAWLALPFVPAVREAMRRRDAAPLAIAAQYGEDRRLGPEAGAPPERGALVARGGAQATSVAPGTLLVAGPALRGASGLDVGALRVGGVATLAERTVVRDRLAAGEAVAVGAGSALSGSVEAGRTLWLAAGCQFERVHAPTVRVDGGPALTLPPTVPAPLAPLPAEADVRAGRTLVTGDLHLPDGARHAGDLVVTGDLSLGAGAWVRGSVKAHGDVGIGPDAVIAGSAFAGGDLDVGAQAEVYGVAAAGATLRLGPACRVGRPDAPATATGRHVVASGGAVVHGTLWAEEEGRTAHAA